MGYIEESLGKGEILVARAHIHWLLRSYHWMGLILAEGVLIWAWWAWHIILPAFVFLAAFFVVLFLMGMLPIWGIEIGLTNHRVILKRGWFSRATAELGLHVIEEVNLSQSFWGRVFNFGAVEVHGTGDDRLMLEWIAEPVTFRRAIETAREQAMQRSANPIAT